MQHAPQRPPGTRSLPSGVEDVGGEDWGDGPRTADGQWGTPQEMGPGSRVGARLWSRRQWLSWGVTAGLRFWGAGICGLGLLTGAVGCGEEPLSYTEVKRLDERITQGELRSFLAVVGSLPEGKMPALSTVYLPKPQWSASRSLRVAELVQEERKMQDERWSVEWLSNPRNFAASKALHRALRRERMTVQQFVGLSLALSLALCREEVPAHIDLELVLNRGRRVVHGLQKDNRVFSTLTDDQAYYVLEQAAWIAVVDRVNHLKLVPPENRSLVHRYRDRLQSVVPEEFRRNPLAEFAKILEDPGLPFEELPDTGSDDGLKWHPEQALVGREG